MKSIGWFSAVSTVLGWTTLVCAQVAPAPVVEQPILPPGSAAVAAPVPATPVAPTIGGERRAVRREDRRIDRNDPTGTLAPTVNPNGTVTATPNAAPAAAPNYANANLATPTVGESWRYRNQNGQWLYYTPANNWVMWNGNSWDPYTPNPAIAVPVAPSTSRVYSYSAPNQNYYNRPYRRGLFGRRYVY